ncbi:hypothetical protein MATL_G00135640 [Megalops atlanticus]|uniref:Uncharacterized protein n=1 Tax=Megalops atlanticus TaxID=7932 RepID=A0A9D3PZI0_MEGAT|nr:hypothetical protein MATL_G00135640 [Megalops atlanticus]
MPRSRQRPRRAKGMTRRLLQRLPSCTPVRSVGRRCPTRRRSSSTSRANTPSRPCLLSWWVWRRKRTSVRIPTIAKNCTPLSRMALVRPPLFQDKMATCEFRCEQSSFTRGWQGQVNTDMNSP